MNTPRPAPGTRVRTRYGLGTVVVGPVMVRLDVATALPHVEVVALAPGQAVPIEQNGAGR